MSDIDVEAISLRQRLAVMNDGTTLPITNMLDHDGEDTEDPAMATVVVIGPTPGGWTIAKVSDYENVQRH